MPLHGDECSDPSGANRRTVVCSQADCWSADLGVIYCLRLHESAASLLSLQCAGAVYASR